MKELLDGTNGQAGNKELSEAAQDPEIQEALAAGAFGEKPVSVTGPLHDVFVEDFRRELAEIQSPKARRLFVLAKANHLSHMRTAEYATLVAGSDVSGHHGVGVLLESCLADHLAFGERTRRLIHGVIEEKMAARAAGRP